MNSTIKIPVRHVVSLSVMSSADDLAVQVARFVDRPDYEYYESPTKISSVEVKDGAERGMVSLCDSMDPQWIYTAQSMCRHVYFVDSLQRLAVYHGHNLDFWRQRRGKGDFIVDRRGEIAPVDDFLVERGLLDRVAT